MSTHTTMTVAELVEQLQRLPQNLPVYSSDGGQYGYGILAHSGVVVVKTLIGEVVYIGNNDGDMTIAV